MVPINFDSPIVEPEYYDPNDISYSIPQAGPPDEIRKDDERIIKSLSPEKIRRFRNFCAGQGPDSGLSIKEVNEIFRTNIRTSDELMARFCNLLNSIDSDSSDDSDEEFFQKVKHAIKFK